jgi:hypothetical protein
MDVRRQTTVYGVRPDVFHGSEDEVLRSRSTFQVEIALITLGAEGLHRTSYT